MNKILDLVPRALWGSRSTVNTDTSDGQLPFFCTPCGLRQSPDRTGPRVGRVDADGPHRAQQASSEESRPSRDGED
jgi:hypothetical protein